MSTNRLEPYLRDEGETDVRQLEERIAAYVHHRLAQQLDVIAGELGRLLDMAGMLPCRIDLTLDHTAITVEVKERT